MKYTFLVLSLFIGLAAFGDERTEKRHLVAELLEVIDARSFTHASFANLLTTMGAMFDEQKPKPDPAEMSPEDRAFFESSEFRAQVEEEERKRKAELREFQERTFAQLDYVKFFDDAYVPLFEEQFTAAELRQLIELFKTPHGQKLARILPQLGIASGWKHIAEAGDKAQEQLKKEQDAKQPGRKTMADMRAIATALEARATDEESYPNVSFDHLEPLLAPTYIRTFPKTDAWGTPFLYLGGGENYRVVSAGADKRFDWSSRQLDPSMTESTIAESMDEDIIFQNGNFLRYPPAESRDQ